MLRRLAPLVAAGVVLTLAGGAVGAPRACRLVVDPAGDDVGTSHDVPPVTDGVYDDGDLDIVGGDIATSRTHVTAVLRTRTMRGATSPDSPLGRLWEFWFTAGEQAYIMSAAAGPDGYDGIVYRVTDDYSDGPAGGPYAGVGIGRAQVAFDTGKGEVRITAPLSHFAPHTPIQRNRLLHDLRLVSFKYYGTGGRKSAQLPNGYGAYAGGGGAGSSVDLAESKRTYNPGTPSCVVVGK